MPGLPYSGKPRLMTAQEKEQILEEQWQRLQRESTFMDPRPAPKPPQPTSQIEWDDEAKYRMREFFWLQRQKTLRRLESLKSPHRRSNSTRSAGTDSGYGADEDEIEATVVVRAHQWVIDTVEQRRREETQMAAQVAASKSLYGPTGRPGPPTSPDNRTTWFPCNSDFGASTPASRATTASKKKPTAEGSFLLRGTLRRPSHPKPGKTEKYTWKHKMGLEPVIEPNG